MKRRGVGSSMVRQRSWNTLSGAGSCWREVEGFVDDDWKCGKKREKMRSYILSHALLPVLNDSELVNCTFTL